MVHEKTAKYPFLIGNTEDSSKEGEYWWSILNIEPKKELFSLTVLAFKDRKLYNNRRQKNNPKNTKWHRKNDKDWW